jgi:hypothetical protein
MRVGFSLNLAEQSWMNQVDGWTERPYQCYVLLGSQEATPAWHWEQWRKIALELDPLLAVARGPAGTSSTQKFVDRKGYVPFRRMGWGDKAHQKWAHGSPTNRNQTNWRFQSTEVWAPTRGVCATENEPPDVFFGIRNEGFLGNESLKFNPVLLLAVASDLTTDIAELSTSAASRIGNIVEAKLQAQTIRPWARPFGKTMVTDSLTDALYVGLFKVGPLHDAEPSLAKLEGNWHLI